MRAPRILADCQRAVDAAWQDRHGLRFNQGVEGRSQQYFSFSHLECIVNLLSYYLSTALWRAELIGL